MEFIASNELAILRWLHIIAMVYWLGGEWGVFQTSYKIVNFRLPIEERARHLETAYRIDILARNGIIALLPLGLHMGYLWGVQPYGGSFLVVVWLLWAILLFVTWAAFIKRGTKFGKLMSDIEDWSRFLLIPTLLGVSIASLLGYGPFLAGEGEKWYSAKVLVFGSMLIIGVMLRVIMHQWRELIPILAKGGDNPEIEAKLVRMNNIGRAVAYMYWVGILTTAFFGAVKPF